MQDVEGGHAHAESLPIVNADATPDADSAENQPLRTALRTVTSTLKAEKVPFALAGGYALWVLGAPEPVHDVDVVVAESDVEAAANALTAAGLRVERPPEDWLFKAFEGDAMVDVLHRLGGVPVDESVLATATEREVLGLRIPVLPATPIMVAKLAALSERNCDLEPLLRVVRAVREQLDWQVLAGSSRDNPFAEAFLFLADRLGITGEDTG